MSIKEELEALIKKGDLTANEIAHIAMTEYYIVLSNQLRQLEDETKLFDQKQTIKKCLDIHISNYKKWKSQYKGTQTTDVPNLQIVSK